MTLARPALSAALRLVMWGVLAVAALPAQADEYATVNQLLRAGQAADALGRTERYLDLRPRDPQMQFLRGVAQTDLGQREAALATFEKLTQDYPELPEPYNNLAGLYAAQGELGKARDALDMAVRINPAYATAHENLGDIHARLAEQSYTRALQLEGGNRSVPPKLELVRKAYQTTASVEPAAAAPAASTRPVTPRRGATRR